MTQNDKIIELPNPRYNSNISVEKALSMRRSERRYNEEFLTLSEVSQLLWAAQGITNSHGFRTAPSAGALYPMEIYICVGNVRGLSPGVYKYNMHKHLISQVKTTDIRIELQNAALGQASIGDSGAVIVLSAVYKRVTRKYGQRGIRYTHMEAGHVAQNIYLQGLALEIGTVVIGAFEDEKVKNVVSMEEDEMPLYCMPLGKMEK